ncbi:hypothetical protein V8E55_003876 [Tylopilus felleus]
MPNHLTCICGQTQNKASSMADRFAELRNSDNLYYPFADRLEWEMAEFLLTSSLSMTAIDRFLSLLLIKRLWLSLNMALRLHGLAKILPKTPPWKCQHVDTSPHETKTIVRLFYRDTVDCLQTLLHNPWFTNSLDLCPYRVFTTAQRLIQLYGEWMSGDTAWNIQSQLPEGACVLGIILSSDKTNVTNQTGRKVSHPLLMSLANIHMDVRAKASLHMFVPIAFLPITKFIHSHSRMKSVLRDHLYHQCLDIMLEPLNIAAHIGVMLSDPLGNNRYCFTPLASCIVDIPEAWTGDPTHIFPPEILHIFTRFFYDHDMRWCICAIGPAEIDFQFSILQPIMNHRCFTTRITNLKQVTGKTQRDIQQYIIPVIAGATPSHIVRAVRMLLDFRYLIQSPTINSDQCHRVSAALEEFHHHKQSIINAGLCCGEKGNILEHWQIPKLEIMQNVTQSIPLMGPPIHWTADITERAHIDVVKIPATSSGPKTDIDSDSSDPDLEDSLEDDESGSFEEPTSSTALHRINDYFACFAKPPLVSPPRSFVSGPVAFHLRFDPVIGSMKICNMAEKYDLQDMRTALVHYFYCNKGHNGQPLHVWYKVRIQQKAYHDLSSVLPAQTLNASP